MKAHELSKADRAEGWGEQLQEWLASDEYRHHARRRILDQIYRQRGFESFLDVGCGSGRLLRDYRERGVRCVGLDLAQEIIDYHARHRDFAVVQGTADQIPFADGYFDLVICLGLVEHLPDAIATMRELLRVTRSGGIALITVPRLTGPFPLLVPFWYYTGGRHRYGWKNMVGKMYTRAGLRRELEESGWCVERLVAFKGSSLLEWANMPFSRGLADLVEGNPLLSRLCGIMLAAVCSKPDQR